MWWEIKCSCNLCQRKEKMLQASDAPFLRTTFWNAWNEDKSTRHFMLRCAALNINLNTLLMLIEASLLAGAIKISPSCAWSKDNRSITIANEENVFKESSRTCCYHLLFFDFCLVKGVNIYFSFLYSVRCEF